MNQSAVDQARNAQAEYKEKLDELLAQRASMMKLFDEAIRDLEQKHQDQMDEIFNQL